MAIENVAEFHARFGLPDGAMNQLDQDAFGYRHRFMQEELNEFEEACNEGDRVKAFDALLDLVYVAFGTALFMGIDTDQWNAGMSAVHAANMQKVRAKTPGQSKRGSILDVVKPEGWKAPEPLLREILDR